MNNNCENLPTVLNATQLASALGISRAGAYQLLHTEDFPTLRIGKRMGQTLIACGIAVMLLPLGTSVSLVGFVMIGLGCAPIYPCLIRATPAHFGADKSQAIIGIQMACAYVGTSLMPPLFGLIAEHITVSLLPVYLIVLLVLMFVMHERLLRKIVHSS